MGDYDLVGIRVQDVNVLNATGTTVLMKRVTYFVGKNGPFTLDYTPGEYTAEKIRADMQKEVEVLKGIGATAGA